AGGGGEGLRRRGSGCGVPRGEKGRQPPPQPAQALSGQCPADGAGEPRCGVHALPARPSRQRGHGRSDRRAAIGRVRRGREPPARSKRHFGLVLERTIMPASRSRSAAENQGGRRFFADHTIYPAIMSDPRIEVPARAPAATSADDTILPFQVEALDLRGRVVRFGPAIDTILSRHRYPTPVAKLLGEAIVLTVLLGSTLKF